MALQVELSPSTPETSQKDVIQPAIPLEKFLLLPSVPAEGPPRRTSRVALAGVGVRKSQMGSSDHLEIRFLGDRLTQDDRVEASMHCFPSTIHIPKSHELNRKYILKESTRP